MSKNNIPRLFINKALLTDMKIELSSDEKHYIKNVLRLKQKDKVNVFNGKDGEWETIVEDSLAKKLICIKQIKKQIKECGPTLYFSLIKNHNLRWMIEKVTELGVQKLVPIITDRTNNKNFNDKKALAHIKEASEVSERLTLPKLEKKSNLLKILEHTKQNSDIIMFCNEAREDDYLQNNLLELNRNKVSFLIGPEGGFSPDEEKLIKGYSHVRSVKLLDRLVRAETAAILALSIFNNYKIR